MLSGRITRCDAIDQDRYGRPIANAFFDGSREYINVNATMVLWRLAIAYRYYSLDHASYEDEAKDAKRGIWAGTFEEPISVQPTQQVEHRRLQSDPLVMVGGIRLRVLGPILLLAGASWLIAAIYDVYPADEIRGFTAVRVDDASGREPAWKPIRPTIYKIIGDRILSKSGIYFFEYDDCEIFSLSHWSCSSGNRSSSIGMENGSYYRMPQADSYRPISQFEHHILICRWATLEGVLQGIAACGLSPFLG